MVHLIVRNFIETQSFYSKTTTPLLLVNRRSHLRLHPWYQQQATKAQRNNSSCSLSSWRRPQSCHHPRHRRVQPPLQGYQSKSRRSLLPHRETPRTVPRLWHWLIIIQKQRIRQEEINYGLSMISDLCQILDIRHSHWHNHPSDQLSMADRSPISSIWSVSIVIRPIASLLLYNNSLKS